jgi:hypothetical protein
MRRRSWTLLAAAALLLLLLLLSGCGNSRTPVPSLSSLARSSGSRTLRYPAAGIALVAPRAWRVTPGARPLVATIFSGSSVVAVWRYQRSDPAPHGARALRHAQQLLIRNARARDPQLELIRSTITVLDGAPAVELDAFEQVAGQARRVRSTHIFERHAEVVLDEYAPPNIFHSVDHVVFSPVKRSLELFRATAA